ncbi:MAG: hypothetical protein KAS23_12875 [Anaerohalosphaera sp.]|nr:hypothetical protein [Anaerohalosphaera sp.]
MPHPVYHLGPCGFFGVIFCRWTNFTVLILANVLIDVEVLAYNFFSLSGPVHQLWHWHTFIVGGIVGAAFGGCVYLLKPVRKLVRSTNRLFAMPCQGGPLKFAISGMLGAWIHVMIDFCYHSDVQALWPYRKNSLWYWFAKRECGINGDYVETACLIFWVLAIGAYTWYLYTSSRKRKPKRIRKK